jgi:hypothetical protein
MAANSITDACNTPGPYTFTLAVPYAVSAATHHLVVYGSAHHDSSNYVKMEYYPAGSEKLQRDEDGVAPWTAGDNSSTAKYTLYD